MSERLCCLTTMPRPKNLVINEDVWPHAGDTLWRHTASWLRAWLTCTPRPARGPDGLFGVTACVAPAAATTPLLRRGCSGVVHGS